MGKKQKRQDEDAKGDKGGGGDVEARSAKKSKAGADAPAKSKVHSLRHDIMRRMWAAVPVVTARTGIACRLALCRPFHVCGAHALRSCTF